MQDTIAEQFIAAIKGVFEEAGKELGADPLEMATKHGPVVDRLQFDRIMSYIEKGKASAQLIVGGNRKGTSGCFIEPTLFVNPNNNSAIWNEEIFGPVLTVKTFKTEDEAIELANDTSYGLAGEFSILLGASPLAYCLLPTPADHDQCIACLYTSDITRALRVSASIESGGVAINSPYLPELNTPFGGTKQSGQGRELGKHGLYSHLEPKAVHIK